jgi:putative transposase
MKAQLVCDALRMAMSQRRPTGGLIVYSDRGAQYASKDYVQLQEAHGFVGSLNRKGNCGDTVMKRFFRSLKTERLNAVIFINHQSGITEVENYIQFYNYKRRHCGIDYMAPHQKLNELKKVA